MSQLSRIKQLDKIRRYLEYAVAKLDETGEFKEVLMFESTSYQDIFSLYPQKDKPLALVIYTGSDYSNNPRRKAEICVFIICENKGDRQEAQQQAIDLIDKTIDALDFERFNKCEFRVTSDKAFDLEEQGVSAYDIRFSLTDQ